MKRNLTIFMSCAGIILLLAGARWDLAISDALYAPDHLFAILLQDGWPLIMKLMLALCFALIADSRPAAYIGWGRCNAPLCPGSITHLSPAFCQRDSSAGDGVCAAPLPVPSPPAFPGPEGAHPSFPHRLSSALVHRADHHRRAEAPVGKDPLSPDGGCGAVLCLVPSLCAGWHLFPQRTHQHPGLHAALPVLHAAAPLLPTAPSARLLHMRRHLPHDVLPDRDGRAFSQRHRRRHADRAGLLEVL